MTVKILAEFTLSNVVKFPFAHTNCAIYQKFFPKVKFDWTTYFNSGFLIYNENHKDLVEAIKKFWIDNDQELYQIQKTKRKGNDQTPVNYMVRHMGHEINYLPKLYNMTHLQRKEILHESMFIDCGYVWHFNGFDKNWREPIMREAWNKIKGNYED